MITNLVYIYKSSKNHPPSQAIFTFFGYNKAKIYYLNAYPFSCSIFSLNFSKTTGPWGFGKKTRASSLAYTKLPS